MIALKPEVFQIRIDPAQNLIRSLFPQVENLNKKKKTLCSVVHNKIMNLNILERSHSNSTWFSLRSARYVFKSSPPSWPPLLELTKTSTGHLGPSISMLLPSTTESGTRTWPGIQKSLKELASLWEAIAAFRKRVCNTEISTIAFSVRYWSCCQIQQWSLTRSDWALKVLNEWKLWNSVGEMWLITWIWSSTEFRENSGGELTRCDKESERNGPLPWDQKRKVNDDVGGPWFYATRI